MAETDYFSVTLAARPVDPYVVSDLAAQETVGEDGVDPTLVRPLDLIVRRRTVTWPLWPRTALQRCRSSRTSVAVAVAARPDVDREGVGGLYCQQYDEEDYDKQSSRHHHCHQNCSTVG